MATEAVAPGTPAASDPALTTAESRWWRHWELWCTVALGAFLRLWHVDMSTFSGDQAELGTIARQAIVGHALPVAGMPFSVHALSPPLSIYLLMPFFALGPDPLPAVLGVAVWNVIGVGLCYIFVLRGFGRRVAVLATLLFATCGAAVGFSRFIWQTNLMPPFTVMWALTLFAGCVRGWRNWLAPNIALLALIAMLHPTALLLAPATLVGALLAPQRPRRRDLTLAVGALALILAPTCLWEIVSRGSDITLLLRYGHTPSTIDLNVVFRMYQVLGGPIAATAAARPGHGIGAVVSLALRAPLTTDFLPGAPYTSLGSLPALISLAAFAMFALGWVTLTLRVAAPAIDVWTKQPAAGTRVRQLVAWAGATVAGLRANAAWRSLFLLWLWVTAPPVLMLRHSGGIYTHYVVALYPAVFVVTALPALLWSDRIWMRPYAAIWSPVRWHLPVTSVTVTTLLMVALAALIAGQTLQSSAYAASLTTGQIDPVPDGYGFPLQEVRSASERISALQRQAGASVTVVESDAALIERLTYLLINGRPDRIGSDDHCLVIHGTTVAPALVVVTTAGSPAGQLLASLPAAVHAADIAMPGGAPFLAYRVSGQVPLLSGDTAVAPVLFRAPDGVALRLDAVAISQADSSLRLRWTVTDVDARGLPGESLRIALRDATANGSPQATLGYHDCAPTEWRTGETVYTWLPMPPASQASTPLPLLLQVQQFQQSLVEKRAGPITLLAGTYEQSPFVTLPASSPSPGARASTLGTARSNGLFLTLDDLVRLTRNEGSG